MRIVICFTLLFTVRVVSRLFWRIESLWVGDLPEEPWQDIRLVAFLNHTSLYEPIFAGAVPASFLWRLATRGVLPVASKTIERPIVGMFFRLLARDVVSITREPDHTWQAVLERISPDSMILLAPEGRMMRADGLDKNGKPMTVRGGIADILRSMPGEGRMLVAHSKGLHHVQVPGQILPRLFKKVRLNIECLDIATYRRQLIEQHGSGDGRFKKAVKEDLERRRDYYRTAEVEGVSAI